MSSIMDKLKKNSTITESAVLSKSKFFDVDFTPTEVPIINAALSGDIDGGLSAGLTVIAGPSKSFKTSFALMMASAYLKRFDDAVLLFYDSEFGANLEYFKSFGIDTDRVIHTPVKHIEALKFDLIAQVEEITKEDNVIIVIDSVGNIASKKEVEDAMNEKSVADMTRAKQLKSVFRMVTPSLTINNIPLIAINHVYDSLSMYSRPVVSGGTGIYYSANNIWVIGRQQDKDGTELKGFHFIINIEKSRFVRERSRIPISVTYEEGIKKYSGLLDFALEGGFVHKGRKGRSLGFCYISSDGVIDEDNMYSEKYTLTKDFWDPIFENTGFKDFVKNKLTMGTLPPIEEEVITEEKETDNETD